MAMIDLGALKVGVTIDTANANTQLNKFEKEVEKSGRTAATQWDKVGSSLTKFGSKLTTAVTLPIVAALGAAVKLASDMQETMGKVNVVFGDNAAQVTSWGDTAIDKMGLAKQTALDMAAGFQDMGTSMGIGNNQSTIMSMNLVQLAADMASFKNISVERAQTALNAVYTGETESLKALGIVMTEANLKAFALNQGITKQYEELTQAEKVQLRYQYVMAMTTNAQGDFERTSSSAANQSRMLAQKIKELGTDFGENLLPFVESVLSKINGLLSAFSNTSESTQNAIIWGALIVAAIGPVVNTIGNVITGIQKVSAAFSAGTLTLATMGWIAAAVAAVALIATIALKAKEHYDAIYKDANDLKNAMSAFSAEMMNIESTFQADMANIQAVSGLASDYIDELVRLEQTGLKTKESQDKYALTIRQLKALMPGLNIEIDKQTGLIVGGASAIRSQTAAWKEQAIQQAMITKQTEQVNALADAIVALNEAKVKSKENDDALAEAQEKLTKSGKELADALGVTTDELNNMDTAELMLRLIGLGKEGDSLTNTWIEQKGAVADLTAGQTALNAEIANAEANVSAATEAVNKSSAAYEEAYGVIADTDAATAGTDAVVDGLNDVGSAADDAAKDIKDFSQDVTDMTSNLKKESDITLKEANANLKANTALYNNLWVNIGALMKRGVSEEFLFYLQQMGPDGWKIIDDMTRATDKQLGEFADSWKENGEAAAQTWETEIGDIPTSTKDAVEEAEDEAKTGGEKVGSAMGTGVETGVKGTTAKIAAQARATVAAAIAAARQEAQTASPSKKTRDLIGKPLAQGIGVGFEIETPNVVKQIKRGLSDIITGGSSVTENAAKQAAVKEKEKLYGGVTNNKTATVTQNNTFTSKKLTPYEQQVQLRRLNKDLAGSYA